MSLWWTRKEQLDKVQLQIIENLPLRESFLVLGPPGSGKSNVLLRRAQFIRSQDMANVMVLTFTRSLVEFMKTGCVYQGREIFPQSCVSTIESWCRRLHYRHNKSLPDERPALVDWKRALAESAAALQDKDYFPKFLLAMIVRNSTRMRRGLMRSMPYRR
jgi:superfamily I DNA/RNA helicase